MSLTALTWAILFLFAVAAGVSTPVAPVLGYLLEYYMRPALKWWGRDLPDLRYNLIMSVALGASFLMHRASLRPVVKTANLAVRWQLFMLATMLTVALTVAVDRRLSFEWITDWTKMAIIFPMLMAGTLRTRPTFDAFLTLHMLGATSWGWEAWQDPKRQAGRLIDIGSGDSLNDNGAAAHLVTVLPFSALFVLVAERPLLRAIAAVSLPFVVNTIILCNSRGSMLGVAAATLAAVPLMRRGRRLRVVGAGVGMVLIVLALADKQFLDRQQTTADPKDNSAQSRLVTWAGAFELVKDRPFGAGGRGFHLLSPRYIPEIVEAHGGDLRAPHNSYAMVASEWGIAGLVAYLGIYASAFLNLSRIKRGAADDGYFYWRALGIQLALVAFLVAGTFTDRLYAEAGYWMVGLSYALLRLQRTEQAQSLPSPDGNLAMDLPGKSQANLREPSFSTGTP